MNQRTYTYKTGKYFSAGGRVMGWITSALGMIMVLNGYAAGWVLVPAGLLTLLAYYMVEFDLQQKTYREGVLLLVLRFGKKRPLPGFDFLFLKKNSYTRMAESRGSNTQFKLEKYDGYVKLSDGTKLHLLQQSQKEAAMQQLKTVANDLGTQLRDLTETVH